MPSGPRYERVPLEEENLTTVTSTLSNYFTGLTNTAPPSFRSVIDPLPHRNDENAATIMPRSERPTPGSEQEIDDPPISLWGASESTTTRENATRDDVLLRLLEAVERLERRLEDKEVAQNKEEVDLEALSKDKLRHARTNDILGAIGAIIFTIIFLIWLGAIIIIPAVAKYKYASAMATAVAAGVPTSIPGVG